MSTAAVFNSLADVMGSALAMAFPDTLTVQTLTETNGTGGMKIKATTANTYTSVPCAVEYIQKFGWRKDQGEKNLSTQKYTVTFPTHVNGTRMTINPATQRLLVAARGDEPAMTLRMDSVSSDMGVVFVAVASKEN
jgi:hypothetical protein